MRRWAHKLIARYNEQAAIVGFVATVVAAVAGLYIGVDRSAVIGVIVVIALLLIIHAVHRQKDLVPEPVDLLSADDFYVQHATPSLLEEAIQIGQRAFPRDSIAPDTVRKLHIIDKTFVCVAVDRSLMQVLGYLDCYALRATAFTKEFIAGTADEDCFDLDSVAPLASLTDCHCLYVAGLVVEEENRCRRGRISRALVALAMETLVPSFKNDATGVLAISVAYTHHGRKMLEAFGLSLCTICDHRKDGGHLYVTKINRRLLRTSLERTITGNHRASVSSQGGMPVAAFSLSNI